jgi:hypothetical protein
MKENRLMQQVTAIFSIFMVFFYLGGGFCLIYFADRFKMDKAVMIIIGSTFMFYGLYRAFRTYLQIKEAFFTDNSED